MPRSRGLSPMSTRRPAVPPLLRDAIVAAVAFALVLVPVVYDLGPTIFRGPGFLLYVPLLVAYIVLGGETENHFGPTEIHVVVYVLVLGLAVAAIAHVVRSRFDVDGRAALEFVGAAVLAVVGTLWLLYGVAGVLELLYPRDGAVFGVVGGLLALVVAVLIARRSG